MFPEIVVASNFYPRAIIGGDLERKKLHKSCAIWPAWHK